jgi:nucleotidyltransferase/DNA polymerase involved in DNA repair
MATISDIEGIVPGMELKLKQVGIRSINQLLEKCATKEDRQKIGEKIGTDEATILKWVNTADLYRVKGLGSEYSQLLERIGISTIFDLKQTSPYYLLEKMNHVNRSNRLVRRMPHLKKIEEIVEYAKMLDQKVSY